MKGIALHSKYYLSKSTKHRKKELKMNMSFKDSEKSKKSTNKE